MSIDTTYPDGVMDDGSDVDDPASWSEPCVNAGRGYGPATKLAIGSTNQPDLLHEDHKILIAGLAQIDELVTSGGSAAGDKPFFLVVGFMGSIAIPTAPGSFSNERQAAPITGALRKQFPPRKISNANSRRVIDPKPHRSWR